MNTLVGIIVFTSIGGLLSLVAAGTLLSLPDRMRTGLIPHLVSFATGALLGAAFLGLLPHAIELSGHGNFHNLGLSILLGILTFFILEKTVLWRHCHSHDCVAHTVEGHVSDEVRATASGKMILVGDAVHNFLDGLMIAAAFLADFELGVVTALAVIAHEIPQEIGDVAILINSGMEKGKVLLTNFLVSLTSVVGGVLGYFALQQVEPYIPYVLGFAASSFIYVAVADLIPGLHRRVDVKTSIKQVVLIVAGILIVHLVHQNMH